MIKKLTILSVAAMLLSFNGMGEVLINEDFSKFTAGTEETPDGTTLTSAKTDPRWEIPAQYTNQAGWKSFYVFQAGGVAYLPKETPTDYLAPSITSPKMDLSVEGGIFNVKFRVRLKDAKLTSDRLYVSTTTTGSNFEIVDITDKWQNFDVVLANGTKDCSVEFWTSNKGDFMIDDIEISTGGGLPTPQNCMPEGYDKKSFTATWSPVEGATFYELDVFTYAYGSSQRVYLDGFKEKEVTDTACFVNGLDETKTYYFMVRARNANSKSALTRATEVRVARLDTPKALPATNVTETGFTANWNGVNLAHGYYVDLYMEHKATADGRFYLLDTDFSKVDQGTLTEPVTYEGQVELDNYVGRSGWYVNNPAFAAGYVGTDNRYATYIGESYITSPELDFSIDGGKTTVSFSVNNPSDYATNVVVEYDVYDANGQLVPIQASQQVIEVPAGESKQSVTLTGGVKNCRVLIIPDATSYNQLFFDDLQVSQMLKAGETVTVGIDRKRTGSSAASYDFVVEKADQDSRYAYTVTAYYLGESEEDDVLSSPSDMIYVDKNVSGVADALSVAVKVYAASGLLHVDNANGKSVQVFNASGALVYSEAEVRGSMEVALPTGGFYIVKVDNKTFKILM